MHLRATYVFPAAALFLMASTVGSFSHPQAAVALRIESLGKNPVPVRVHTIPLGSERRAVHPVDTLVLTPADLTVADSIGRIHVLVSGYTSVRVTLKSRLSPSDSLISTGRDITLVRRTASGRFERIWTAQPLIP